MQIVDYVIVLCLLILSFIAGMRLDNYYHNKAELKIRDALEKQFVRLRAKADADDPCRPYGTPQIVQPIPVSYNTGDFDGDGQPLKADFMEHLQENGKASVKFRKSDLAK